MERTRAVPRYGLAPPELVALATANGPFASIYVETEAQVENAAHRSEVHWKDLRRGLSEAGADEKVLTAIDPLVPDAHLEGSGLGVIASRAGLLHVEHLPELRHREIGRWAPLPSVGPLIAWRQWRPPHVVVLADRKGADLFAFVWGHAVEQQEAREADYPIRKVKPGGWSQRRYQERAENTWEKNAADVAERVAHIARRVGARLIAVGGDVRAVSLIEHDLPADVRDLVHVISVGRASDGSEDLLTDEVAALLTLEADRETDELLDQLRDDLPDDLATEGLLPTLAALAEARVDTLLIADDQDDDWTVWAGELPTQVACTPEEVQAQGVNEPVTGRWSDAAIRAALGSGASVRIVDDSAGLADGIGSLLRWSEGGGPEA